MHTKVLKSDRLVVVEWDGEIKSLLEPSFGWHSYTTNFQVLYIPTLLKASFFEPISLAVRRGAIFYQLIIYDLNCTLWFQALHFRF